MAEAWANVLHSHSIEARSAGIVSSGMDSQAVRVMAEVGMDIAGNRSKPVSEVGLETFDYVITLSDYARDQLPAVLGSTRLFHAGFEAPSKSSLNVSSPSEVETYRRVRDEIRSFVASLTL